MGIDTARYDLIGHGYAKQRRPDPRIARLIDAALGDARSVVNVGAGTGSYEPVDRAVTAVEPSSVMIAQRPAGAAPVIQGWADHLPFADNTFDAAMAILTVHHWPDCRAGLAEMRRVARDRVVLLTWDPDHAGFWLVNDYFPEIIGTDRRIFSPLPALEAMLGSIEIQVVPIPHDCVDGFLGAYWRRPEAYLDRSVRAGISSFARLDDVAPRIERLRADLEDGTWEMRNGALRDLEEIDLGYRLVIGSGGG